ncbi:triose-phosphate isomerase family protein [Kushneria phosphatilytica]|uniref:Triosephosphate isomerase n=1 Tax=Kushneria phosphatilytica TaxID=657387 RepID=A0A1S1NP31_9GAMM|nr:triose-phosphate isomerase family protein [Kushneria phosphatilytica]OHV09172.1 triose-phosphate isomerase [Kushneria phosphatilytica]QEL12325.1 triosephosphate isomerase [Kushneria phosphatilytica]
MTPAPPCLGTSLKMYFGYHETLAWCRAIADMARHHPLVTDGGVELFVLPSFPLLAPVLEIFRDTGVGVGAQNLHWQDSGAFTGEVSGALLAEMGCQYVEVGHAERRRLFGEDEEVVTAKTTAAARNGLIPILCIGEAERGPSDQAADECIRQVEAAMSGMSRSQCERGLIVAYEPHWAIGASEPASTAHIGEVCARLRQHLAAWPATRVIYGGSAGPGLLTRLSGQLDGLFLGRFVHDPAAFARLLDEAAALNQR